MSGQKRPAPSSPPGIDPPSDDASASAPRRNPKRSTTQGGSNKRIRFTSPEVTGHRSPTPSVAGSISSSIAIPGPALAPAVTTAVHAHRSGSPEPTVVQPHDMATAPQSPPPPPPPAIVSSFLYCMQLARRLIFQRSQPEQRRREFQPQDALTVVSEVRFTRSDSFHFSR